MKAINPNNYEEWLFEYFEGSLSKEEKNELLNFTQRDPVLQEEFNYWEKSYIREPLPAKLKIEGALLKNTPIKMYGKYASIGLILVVGIAYYLFNLKSTPPLIREAITEETIQSKVTEEIITSKSIHVKPKAKEEKIFIKNTQQDQEQKIPGIVSDIPDEIVIQDSLQTITKNKIDTVLEATEISSKISDSAVGNKSVAISSFSNRKKYSSKESRKMHRLIEKHKRRERANREADKFLKGNKPYVVPLDPNTF